MSHHRATPRAALRGTPRAIAGAALALLLAAAGRPAQAADAADAAAAPDAAGSTAPASAAPANNGLQGEVRLRWDARRANPQGPLAAAHRLDASLAPPAPDSAVAELLLRHAGTVHLGSQSVNLAAEGLAWVQRDEGGPSDTGGRINQLHASVEAGAWGYSAGKKVVSWDVGFGFRPNDVVQQEARRSLLAAPLEGRPLLQAEHFGADSATTLVWVNPQSLDAPFETRRGAQESALALRHYHHAGSADWHGFARLGAHTGASLGGALAWVAGDAWALHGSLRWLQRHDALPAPAVAAGALLRQSPYGHAIGGATGQALLGLQWTGEARQSLLLEAWHDGTAPSDATWDAWGRRNAALAASPAPAGPRAGNLAWQAGAFDRVNLRRDTVFTRLAWAPERWQLALDLLWHPADGGRTVTASLQWQGERWRIDAALRQHGGPADAVLAQLPTRCSAVLAAAWLF